MYQFLGYSQHIIISICSIIFLFILFIILAILWQRRIRRRMKERKCQDFQVATTVGSSTLADINGKNAVVWDSTRCPAMNLHQSLDIHHLHPGYYRSHCHHHYHDQQKQQEQQQNHIILTEMNTFHSALL